MCLPRMILRGETTLRRSGRSITIGLKLDVIPLHAVMLTQLLRMGDSGEEESGVGDSRPFGVVA
jgi:hypothetical protein